MGAAKAILGASNAKVKSSITEQATGVACFAFKPVRVTGVLPLTGHLSQAKMPFRERAGWRMTGFGVIPPGKISLMTLTLDAGFHDVAGKTVRRGITIENNDPNSTLTP